MQDKIIIELKKICDERKSYFGDLLRVLQSFKNIKNTTQVGEELIVILEHIYDYNYHKFTYKEVAQLIQYIEYFIQQRISNFSLMQEQLNLISTNTTTNTNYKCILSLYIQAKSEQKFFQIYNEHASNESKQILANKTKNKEIANKYRCYTPISKSFASVGYTEDLMSLSFSALPSELQEIYNKYIKSGSTFSKTSEDNIHFKIKFVPNATVQYSAFINDCKSDFNNALVKAKSIIFSTDLVATTLGINSIDLKTKTLDAFNAIDLQSQSFSKIMASYYNSVTTEQNKLELDAICMKMNTMLYLADNIIQKLFRIAIDFKKYHTTLLDEHISSLENKYSNNQAKLESIEVNNIDKNSNSMLLLDESEDKKNNIEQIKHISKIKITDIKDEPLTLSVNDDNKLNNDNNKSNAEEANIIDFSYNLALEMANKMPKTSNENINNSKCENTEEQTGKIKKAKEFILLIMQEPGGKNNKEIRNLDFKTVLNYLLALDPEMKIIGDFNGAHFKLDFFGLRRILVVPHSYKKNSGMLDGLFLENIKTFLMDSGIYNSIKNEKNIDKKEVNVKLNLKC